MSKARIIASCGHEVQEMSDLVDVRLATEDCDAVDGFYRTVSYAVYCPPCGDHAKNSSDWIEDDASAEAWMRYGTLRKPRSGEPN